MTNPFGYDGADTLARAAAVLRFLRREGVDEEDIASLFDGDNLSNTGEGRLREVARLLVPRPFHLLDGTLTAEDQAAFWQDDDGPPPETDTRFAAALATRTNPREQPLYLPAARVGDMHCGKGDANYRLIYGARLLASLLTSWHVDPEAPAWRFVHGLARTGAAPEDREVAVLPLLFTGSMGPPFCLLVDPCRRELRQPADEPALVNDALAGVGMAALLAMHGRRNRPGRDANAVWPQNRLRTLIPGFRCRDHRAGTEHVLGLSAEYREGSGARGRAMADVAFSWVPYDRTDDPHPWTVPACQILLPR